MKNTVVRVKLISLDDSEKLQGAKVQGRNSELYGSDKRPIIRHQQAGLSSRPSKGVGIVLNLEGNADQAILITLENPDARPTDIAEGETRLYDENGQFLHFKTAETDFTVLGLTVTSSGDIAINAPGKNITVNCDNATVSGTTKVVVDSPRIELGAGANKRVAISGATITGGVIVDAGCATEVFAK
jgi:phage gp45-like